jgi:hypothetical protein
LRAPQYLKNEEITHYEKEGQDVGKYYGSQDSSLSDLHPIKDGENLIWAISNEGALLIEKEIGDRGHPSITGFKPARIAGELYKECNIWKINSKSGRYSKDYNEPDQYLQNARIKFKEIFRMSDSDISYDTYRQRKLGHT